MRSECVQAVTKAIGRALNSTEAQGIEERVKGAMRTLARQDPAAWNSKSAEERVLEAGTAAAKELQGEALLKKRRAALQIAAHQRVGAAIGTLRDRGVSGLDALDRVIAFNADGRSNVESVESWSRAVERDALRQMLGTLSASNPKWFGLFENHDGVRAIVREIFGEDSGVTEARAGAKEWHQVAETLRQRFNRAGGDVGKLEDWGMPHHHSQIKVAKAGRDQWVADILPRLEREAYVNEDGSRMSDEQLSDFLKEAWATIATGGANKIEPGRPSGGGMRANRGNASRQIHFKDADSYLDYQSKYGERSLYEVLVGHIASVAKNIALVETLGPNPDHAWRFFRDEAVRETKLADPTRVGKVDNAAIQSEALYNIVGGKSQPVANAALARSFDTLRSWLGASRLGSAIITSFSDDSTLYLTSKLNNLPQMRVLANELSALNPTNKTEERMALRAGLAMNTLIASLNRFGEEGLGRQWVPKLTTAVLRASGLNAITEARRRAFGVTMMSSLGSVAREHADLAALDKADHRILLSKGVTETDFGLWKKAQLEDWGGRNDTMLTPESIYRVPDAEVDKVIGPQIQRLKDEADAQITDLKARDAQDQQWITDRASNLSKWLKQEQAKVEKRIARADDAAKTSLRELAGRLGKLDENLEYAASAWQKPPTPDVPGIDTGETVGFYGKSKLRSLGVAEGRTLEAIRTVKADARDIGAQLKRMKVDLLEGLFEKFHERQAELTEFSDRAQARADRRAKVADRIQRDIDPAIANARISAREQAATRLLAAVLEETDVAVIEPGAKERAFMGAGLQRGSLKGELTRSVFLFKSFPLAMLMRHWSRGMNMPTGTGRAAYLATLIATTTIAGMASLQINELLSGRDPRNVNPFEKGGVRNWLAAMLKGGSLGIYGDFLFSDSTQYGGGPVATALGPVFGLGEDVFKLTQGNLVKALQGKDTNFGAELVKFVKSNTPAASLWYAKAALDHLIFHRLQEYFSPGYLSKMRRRAYQEFGQRYWWEPGTAVPDRPPDLQAAVGE
jgi:hypothetical protein